MMMKIESKYNDEDGGAKYCDEYDYGHDEDKSNMMIDERVIIAMNTTMIKMNTLMVSV